MQKNIKYNTNSQKILECNNLTIGYSLPLVKNISFNLSSSQIVFVKGKNGSGKSTLIKTILGKIPPINGNYSWQINEECISYLPQITNPTSHFSYTIGEILNLYDIATQHRNKLPQGLEDKKWIDASGGEKQKVMLLSRLSNKTEALILDEPFNHLDSESINSLVDLLVDLVTKSHLSVVMVSHLEVSLPDEIQKVVEL